MLIFLCITNLMMLTFILVITLILMDLFHLVKRLEENIIDILLK